MWYIKTPTNCSQAANIKKVQVLCESMGPKGKYFQARAVNSCYINPGFKSYLNQSRHSERCLVWVSPSLSPPIYSLTTESIDYTDDSLHTPSLLFFFLGTNAWQFLSYSSESFDQWSQTWLNIGSANSSSKNAHRGMIWITHIP